jgi:hypothetical protein
VVGKNPPRFRLNRIRIMQSALRDVAHTGIECLDNVLRRSAVSQIIHLRQSFIDSQCGRRRLARPGSEICPECFRAPTALCDRGHTARA